jgi:hypothetical protein
MSVESNINYLDYEIKSNKDRIALMEKYLRENPSVSIYKRKINQRVYYYKKYRKDGRSISEYLGSNKDNMDEVLETIKAKSSERGKVKENRRRLKKINTALEKQLRIARKAYTNANT